MSNRNDVKKILVEELSESLGKALGAANQERANAEHALRKVAGLEARAKLLRETIEHLKSLEE